MLNEGNMGSGSWLKLQVLSDTTCDKKTRTIEVRIFNLINYIYRNLLKYILHLFELLVCRYYDIWINFEF